MTGTAPFINHHLFLIGASPQVVRTTWGDASITAGWRRHGGMGAVWRGGAQNGGMGRATDRRTVLRIETGRRRANELGAREMRIAKRRDTLVAEEPLEIRVGHPGP